MKIIVVTHRCDSVAAWAFHIHEVGVWVLKKMVVPSQALYTEDSFYTLWTFKRKFRRNLYKHGGLGKI